MTQFVVELLCPSSQFVVHDSQIYKNRELAVNDVADYIDRFYNGPRRRSHLGGVSPEQFEAAQKPR